MAETDLLVSCPHCKTQYHVSPDLLGQRAECPRCARQFTMAPLSDEPLKPEAPPPEEVVPEQQSFRPPGSAIVSCVSCGVKYDVPVEFLGDSAECSECGELFTLAEDPEAVSDTTEVISAKAELDENENLVRFCRKKVGMLPNVKPFYVVVVIPKDTEISKAQRGLILFQEIGIYGVKTVTTKAMQEFFSKKLGLSFRTQNLAPDFYLKKLFESGMIQKIKLARNVQSNDTADKLYGAGYGREERTLVPIKITNQMKAKLRHVSEAKYNYFTFDNHDYPETKMVVKIGDRLRTIDLHGLDELSVEEALPDELLLPDGTIDFPNFETHMLEVAEEYIEHLPNKF